MTGGTSSLIQPGPTGSSRWPRSEEAIRRASSMSEGPPDPAFRSPSRRDFLRLLATGSGALAVGAGLGLPELLAAYGPAKGVAAAGQEARNPLRFATEQAPRGIELVAAPGQAEIGGGIEALGWYLNDELPSPLLRVRRGDLFQVEMTNRLPQDLILHWHGLAPPEEMDGHPRFAVPPGGAYSYRFTVEDRAGTYWYHSHAHMRTAEQTYRGIAGLLIVEDEEEDALGLPSGDRELAIILQDRRLDGAGQPYYEPFGPDMMAGYMGPEPFANGIRRPYQEVDADLYRLRVLNGSNARIFRLALSDGRPFTLIGNDGGLIDAPVELAELDLAPAERLDLLVDLRDLEPGERLMLRSASFSIQGGMGFMRGANLQGQPLDLLEFRVEGAATGRAEIPSSLPTVPGPRADRAVRTRSFDFDSRMMNHFVNGRSFQMDRVDARVPFGETELWSFVNRSGLPHPVHLHATHFRVVSRSGGRGRVMPWEAGVKDTVLVQPGETVEVAVQFTAQRGLFLLHCHNLEHEDMGMMANILVE